MIKLFKKQCQREGYEKYNDYFMVWKHNDKIYEVRVRPVFYKDTKFFEKKATLIDNEEPIEKYL